MLNIFDPQGNFLNVMKEINKNKKFNNLTILNTWMFHICRVLAMALTRAYQQMLIPALAGEKWNSTGS